MERYTQDGSTGASDGDEFSDQWGAESDGGNGEAVPHTHTHTHTQRTGSGERGKPTGKRNGQQNFDSSFGSNTDEQSARERETGFGSSTGGCGCTGRSKIGPSQVQESGRNNDGILAMAMPEKSSRLRTKTNSYNSDPKVADYASAEEVMEIFLNACK